MLEMFWFVVLDVDGLVARKLIFAKVVFKFDAGEVKRISLLGVVNDGIDGEPVRPGWPELLLVERLLVGKKLVCCTKAAVGLVTEKFEDELLRVVFIMRV